MGCRQCLPLSVVQQKGKHCQIPHCRNGVVDTFGQYGVLEITHDTKVLSSHSSSTRDLTRLLYHYIKPNTRSMSIRPYILMKFSVSDHCVCGALPNGKRTPQRDQRDICFGHLCSVQCSKFELENEEKFHSSASLPFFFVRLQCACALANSLSFHIWAWLKPHPQFFCFKLMSIALFLSKNRIYRRGNDRRIKNHG